MGKGLANPIGTFWSVVMLLEHLGEMPASQRLMQAIEAVTANKKGIDGRDPILDQLVQWWLAVKRDRLTCNQIRGTDRFRWCLL